MKHRVRILLVEQEPFMRATLRDSLEAAGFTVSLADTATHALQAAAEEIPRAAVVSSRVDSAQAKIRRRYPTLPIITVIDVERASARAKSFSAGAVAVFSRQLLLSPPQIQELVTTLHNEVLKEDPTPTPIVAPGMMIGTSKQIEAVRWLARRFAPRPAPVLILGPTGSGKQLVGEFVHAESKRKGRFVQVNCAALPGELLESELFGHVKGAFTGAYAEKVGMLEYANGGTMFLDEISKMPLPLQSKLLNFLDDSLVRRVGSNASRHVDVRIIAASNVDLQAISTPKQTVCPIGFPCGRDGVAFQADLFYRLNVLVLTIPSLQAHSADIPILAEFFRVKEGANSPALSPEAVACLMSYPWPGNVRELSGAIKWAVAVCDEAVILPKHLPEKIGAGR